MTKTWLSQCWQLGLAGSLAIVGVVGCGVGDRVKAQITPDNTLGTQNSVVTPNVEINGIPSDQIDGGATRGANLFHSFQQFNIGAGRGAYFSNPAGIENILGRVTGGSRSSILGRLGVLGNANLFLINPNGIIFGANASLDVSGSFVGTSASAIGFGNQGSFSASTPNAPPLLTVNPSAFLFNQIASGSIENRSVAPAGLDQSGASVSGLRVGDGHSLLLLGGDVALNGGQLNALGGRVELAGVAGSGTVGLNVAGNHLQLSIPDELARADVYLRALDSNTAKVDVEASNGGSIAISARNIDMSGGSVLRGGIETNWGFAGAAAGDISLNATGAMALASSDIFNLVQTGAVGKGGNINIQAGSLSVTDSAQIDASTRGQGDAGSVNINARDTVSFDGVGSNGFPSAAFSDVESEAVGNGGNINITTGSLSVTNGARLTASTFGKGDAGSVNINARDTVSFDGVSSDGELRSVAFSDVESEAIGNGGNINITTGSLSVTDGAQLIADTSGKGDAGSVNINARDTVSFDRGDVFSDVESRAEGNGGSVNITAGSLFVTNGAQLVANTSGKGDAGSVTINARDTVSFNGVDSNGFPSAAFSNVKEGAVGNGGNINIITGSLSVTNDAFLNASTFGQGNAGSVFVQANGSVSLINGRISSNVGDTAVGKGGNIDIQTGWLSLTGNDASLGASNLGGQGDAGNINIQAGSLSLTDGALLFASSGGGQGDAGDVFVQVTGSVSLANSQIYTAVGSGAVGNAGNINIQAGSLSLTEGAFLGANNFGGQGDAGNINIQAGSLALSDGAELGTSTFGQGDAGNVSVQATDSVTFANSNIFSNVESGAVGNGGNINIAARSLFITDGAQLQTLVSRASDDGMLPAGQGKAGSVNINVADAVTIVGVNDGFPSGIRSSLGEGARGSGGDITIKARSLFVTNGAALVASSFGQGDAGSVTMTASDTVSFSGVGSNGFSSGALSIVGQTGVGKGGGINITTGSLYLMDDAQLSSSTLGQGDAGDVSVQATDLVSFANSSNIFSNVESGAVGNGGNINIAARSLFVTDGAQLQTIVRRASDDGMLPAGQGKAGSVNINVADAVTIVGVNDGFPSGIRSLLDEGARGSGGDITIKARSLFVTDGAALVASTFGQGDAGSVTLTASDTVSFGGVGSNGFSSGSFSIVGETGVGKGGGVNIRAGSLSLTNEAIVSAQSQGTGSAGNITIDARQTLSANNSDITTAASQSTGGAINVTAGNISLRGDSDITTKVSSGEGSGGNIYLSADSIIAFDDSDILAFAENQGGDITLDTPAFFSSSYRPAPPNTDLETLDGNNQVDINASGAIAAGNITLPDTSFLQNSLTDLPVNLIATETLIANSCVTRSRQQKGSFIITGTGGFPKRPGDAYSSPFPTGTVRSIPSSDTSSAPQSSVSGTIPVRPWKLGDPIVEAQGVYRLADGQLVLSRECPK